MPGERHVALVGFMAAGKTTIGKHLAQELQLPFVDTDDLIVARHGPIAQLFERFGEDAFRRLEYEAVREALNAPRRVIALGGGAVTYAATRCALRENALSVYLQLPVETLLERLERSHVFRPVAGAQPSLESVSALLAAREPAYLAADLVVPGPLATKRDYARAIAERLRERTGDRPPCGEREARA